MSKSAGRQNAVPQQHLTPARNIIRFTAVLQHRLHNVLKCVLQITFCKKNCANPTRKEGKRFAHDNNAHWEDVL